MLNQASVAGESYLVESDELSEVLVEGWSVCGGWSNPRGWLVLDVWDLRPQQRNAASDLHESRNVLCLVGRDLYDLLSLHKIGHHALSENKSGSLTGSELMRYMHPLNRQEEVSSS